MDDTYVKRHDEGYRITQIARETVQLLENMGIPAKTSFSDPKFHEEYEKERLVEQN